MSGFIHSIALKITGESAVMKATATVSKLDSAVDGVASSAVTASDKMTQMGRRGDAAFSSLVGSAKRFIATVGIAATVLGSMQAAAQFEGTRSAIEFASGSAEAGAKNLKFLDQTADALGLNITSLTSGFKTWQGSVMGTNLAGQKSIDIFYAMSEASAVMRLTGEQTEGAMLAMGQMISKGKVSAEELRGQLGERLPGAFGIAARAMGVTTGELDKMLVKGELMAEDFLPKFAAELHKTFGGATAEAAQSATANFNRFGNELTTLKVAFGEQLLPVATQFLQNFLIPGVTWLKENITWLTSLSAALAAGYGAYKLITIGMTLWNAAAGIGKFVVGLFTGSIWKMNAALWANPIGIVIAVIIAMVGAVVYAWNKWEGFRASLTAVWSVLKETGKIIGEFLIAPFKILGKIMAGVFTLDKDKIKEGIKEAANFMQNTVLKAGERIGNAWTTGYEKGQASFQAAAAKGGPKLPDAISSAFGGQAPGDAGAPTPGGTGDAAVQNKISGISGGGKSQKNITINLGKFFEDIVINSKTAGEGVDQISDMVLRRLLQVLNSANAVQ